MRVSAITAAAGGLAVFAPQSLACFMDPPDPPPTFWTVPLGDTDGDGGTNFLLAQEVGLFNEGITSNCSCGLGILGSLPAGFEVNGVGLSVWNKVTGERTPVDEFNSFASDPQFDLAYQTLRPGTGEQWFGFGGEVPVFTTPILDADEVFKVEFSIDVPGGFATLNGLTGVVGAGKADASGFPLTTGPHAVTFFSPLENTLPSPSTAALALIGLASMRRRR